MSDANQRFCPHLPCREAPCASTESRWAKFWAPTLNDPRDVVFINTALLLAAVIWPGALAVVILHQLDLFGWWLLPAYGVLFGLFPDRCTLMLHCTVHRPLFNKRFRLLNNFIPWCVAPFYGHTPFSFFAHHMGMHHKEGNLLGDLSSTMPYQRDRVSSWLHYWGKFLAVGLPELALYHWRNGHKRILRKLLVGELTYWLAALALGYFAGWQVALMLCVTPVIIMRTVMMMGNWGQHAFVDQRDPQNDFTSSITCINTRYNRRCFNDGYHIVHHRKPAMHYTEMADEFDKHRALYGENDAIVFDGYDFFQVWALLMLGRKRSLAKAFVRLPGAPTRNDDEVIELLNERMRPFDAADTAADALASEAG